MLSSLVFYASAVLVGDHTVDNAGPLPMWDYLGASDSIHEQLRDVPDGSQVVLEMVNKPHELGAGTGVSGT